PEELPARAVFEVPREQLDEPAARVLEPQRSELRVIACGTVEELDPAPVARDDLVQLSRDRLQLRPHVSAALARETLHERRRCLVVGEAFADVLDRCAPLRGGDG